MANLIQLLKQREGVRTTVYLDSRNKPTVGVGHLVLPADNLKVGDEITDQQVTDFLTADSAKALAAAKSQAAKARIKDSNFIIYLASVNYQLGTGWTKVFKKTWKMILDGDYEGAAKSLLKSKWNTQTPTRVKDFQKALRKLLDKNDQEE